ncbi:hypothetical protein M422DRAFT_33131, partial [Sphaerobolus stellatus SS14]
MSSGSTNDKVLCLLGGGTHTSKFTFTVSFTPDDTLESVESVARKQFPRHLLNKSVRFWKPFSAPGFDSLTDDKKYRCWNKALLSANFDLLHPSTRLASLDIRGDLPTLVVMPF